MEILFNNTDIFKDIKVTFSKFMKKKKKSRKNRFSEVI